MEKVYLAGKIAKNDWRHKIFKGLRGREEFDSVFYDSNLKNDRFIYNGPYFTACDHGCYHGRNTHGRILKDNCWWCGETSDITNSTREEVIGSCLYHIKTSKYIFAWINSKDAYGTFFELGYARSLNKRIFIGIDKELIYDNADDLWFILKSAHHVIYTDNAEMAWNEFINFDWDFYR